MKQAAHGGLFAWRWKQAYQLLTTADTPNT